jgi:hypothetical protein
MDAQIENHLPLITSRIVFAPRVFLRPPTITSRMEFPSINIEARDDSPVPNGHLPAGTPGRARTPKRARPLGHINTVVAFDKDKDRNSLSPLEKSYSEKSYSDADEHEETRESEAEHEIGGEGMIPKPKGEVGRPGGGGYTLFKALDWNQKTYDNIHVSEFGVYMKESTSQ